MAMQPPSPRDSLLAHLRLERITNEYWQYALQSRPEIAAREGTAVERLPDPTQESAKRDAQVARAVLAALDEIYVEALAEDAYVTWQSLRWEMELLGSRVAYHWTRLADVAPGQSWFDRAVEILRSHPTDTRVALDRYRTLVSTVGRLTDSLRVEFLLRRERGIMLSAVAADRAASHVRSFIAPAAASPFMPVSADSAPADSARASIRRDVGDIIEREINPSLEALAAYFDQPANRESNDIGLSRFPGGSLHYANLLRFHATVDVTPEAAHTIGLDEVARAAAAVASMLRTAGMPANRESIRTLFERDSTVGDPVQVVDSAASLYRQAAERLGDYFGIVSGEPLVIGPMSDDDATSSVLTRYEPGVPGRHRARYVLNVSQLASWRSAYLPSLIFADLVPGRHHQLLTQESSNAGNPFRRQSAHTGFVAGWEEYAVAVADSLAPASSTARRLAVRVRDLATACGLVVDTGINALGWSRSTALEFLRSWLPEDDATLEREFTVRAIEAPGTMAAAALGARELRGLRRWVERELGPRFDLGAFHSEVLRVGSVPLPVLGTHLERWIWDVKRTSPP
jgi:uncharacterized protein (DUF885 family)